MLHRRLIQSFIVCLVLSAAYVAGTFTYQYMHDPIRPHHGVWTGSGHIMVQGKQLTSHATLIIEKNGARLSVSHRYQNHYFTYDVDLLYKRLNHERNHLEIKNRSVNGLKEFIEATSIQIPPLGTLLSVDAWNLEKNELFVNLQSVNNESASFHMTRRDEK